MIGKISMGKSFRGCINYCLQDKKLDQKIAFIGRAKILFTNYCFGSNHELVEQFNDVRSLNTRVEKPVLHISLSLSPEDHLEQGKLKAMVRDMAREMGFEKNQYLAVSHLDTNHPHVHLVVNRIGLNGGTWKDSHCYQKIAAACRRLELKYGLKQVLSPRKYLSPAKRLIPRHDRRKEKLRQHIQKVLPSCRNWEDFEAYMRIVGYRVKRGLGISFTDEKGVKIKGSEVGYALGRIQRELILEREQKQGRSLLEEQQEWTQRGPGVYPHQRDEKSQHHDCTKSLKQAIEQTSDALLKPAPVEEGLNQELLPKQKKKWQKHRSHHL